MLYLSLSIFISTIVCINGRFTTPPTGTPIPEGDCGSLQAQRDNCFDFGQWLDIVRAPQDHYFIKCNNGTPVCQRCAADTHWSPKCQRCEYYKDDSLNQCPPPTYTTVTPAKKSSPPYNMSFCEGKPNENFEHETYKAVFYACNHGNTYLMHCPGNLWFDKSCDACVYPWMYNTGNHIGKKR